MRIHTRLTYQWSKDRYVLIGEEGFDYEGLVAECKGASQEQNDLAKSQSEFYGTLTKDYESQFAKQDAIQASLNASLKPIIEAGPGQFGYSKGETDALNSTAINGTATAFANAKRALQENQAAEGGGNAYLPSGVKAQQDETLAAQGANQESSELEQIQTGGFDRGYQTFEKALDQEQGVANAYNPTAIASTANTSGSDAGTTLKTINDENAASSPWGAIGGILGGGLSAFAGGFGSDVGKAVGKKIG